MVVSLDDSWAICNPTKTGTYSIESALVDKAMVGYKLLPRHRIDQCVPGARRYMIVRDPLERWTSLYWFLRRVTGYLNKYSHDINVFTREWVWRRKHQPWWMYTFNLTEHAEVWQPEKYFKTENLQELLDYFGIDDIKLPFRNKTKARPNVKETLKMLEPDLRQAVVDWAAPDQANFGY